jgi:hypothetical protein
MRIAEISHRATKGAIILKVHLSHTGSRSPKQVIPCCNKMMGENLHGIWHGTAIEEEARFPPFHSTSLGRSSLNTSRSPASSPRNNAISLSSLSSFSAEGLPGSLKTKRRIVMSNAVVTAIAEGTDPNESFESAGGQGFTGGCEIA